MAPQRVPPLRLVLALTALFALGPVLNAAPGDLDPLDANIVGTVNKYVYATAVQPDGKILLAGLFTSVLGVPRLNIARLNTDGTLDMGFDPAANDRIYSVTVQADGKVLLTGNFTTLQPNGAASPITRQYIARVNADGTLDTSFNPKPNGTVFCVAVEADGRMLLGGAFTSLQPNGAASPTVRNQIARVYADGSLDLGFDPKANATVDCVALQADGKVLIGGQFTTLQPNGAASPTARNRIARVNVDGSLDTGFDPKADSWVLSVVVQADGKVLLGGDFGTLQPNGAALATPRKRIARINADGSLDTGFDPWANAGTVFSVALQADGKILLSGSFHNFTPNMIVRDGIARLNADGSVAMGFDPNANNAVRGLAVQADGKVLVGGDFSALQPNGAPAPTTRNLFARLQNDPAVQSLSMPDATHALWQRGGAAPEVSQVTFELSSDGGSTWSPLGAGSRVGATANWQRTGLSLPASGLLRARGRTAGGHYSASSGLIEQVASFTRPLTQYEQWKLAQLGDANAPDIGNGDGDAFVNLAEYGLVLDPTAYSAGPEGGPHEYAGGTRLRIVFTRDPARNDVTIEAEAADDMAGPWSTVASSVLGAPMSGAGYVGGDNAGAGLKTVEVRDVVNVGDPAHPRRYLRLRVKR